MAELAPRQSQSPNRKVCSTEGGKEGALPGRGGMGECQEGQREGKPREGCWGQKKTQPWEGRHRRTRAEVPLKKGRGVTPQTP